MCVVYVTKRAAMYNSCVLLRTINQRGALALAVKATPRDRKCWAVAAALPAKVISCSR